MEPQNFTCRTIEKAIGSKHLRLFPGNGYFYFVYDDGNWFETKSVMVYRLRSIPFDAWVATGKAFVSEIKEAGEQQ